MDSDSDFYGDDDEIQELQARVTAHKPSAHLQTRQDTAMARSSPPIKEEEIKQEIKEEIKEESKDTVLTDYPLAPQPPPTQQLHNPYEGRRRCAKQLHETTDAFLARLPPATTDASPVCPWIYVANPFIPREDRGGEEAPAEFGTQLGRFMEGGQERLDMFGDMVREAEEKKSNWRVRGGPSVMAVNREIARSREECKSDILMLAQALKVRTGKWMLFIAPTSVNQVWGTVVRATVNNELGIAAKVAPRAERGSPQERLICIYTYDFADLEDVSRVLGRMRQLGLVRSGPGIRPIYYKADAYTYLGIGSVNPWGLRASIYSSSEPRFARTHVNPGPSLIKEETDVKVKDEPEDTDGWKF